MTLATIAVGAIIMNLQIIYQHMSVDNISCKLILLPHQYHSILILYTIW